MNHCLYTCEQTSTFGHCKWELEGVTPSTAVMLCMPISVIILVENSVGRTDWPAPTNRKNAMHLGVYTLVCGEVWCMYTDPCSEDSFLV